MSDSNKPGPTQLKELMTRVFDSDASEAFGDFVVRQAALNDMAPNADHALVDGVEASPDGGAAMSEAHLLGLSDDEREDRIVHQPPKMPSSCPVSTPQAKRLRHVGTTGKSAFCRQR